MTAEPRGDNPSRNNDDVATFPYGEEEDGEEEDATHNAADEATKAEAESDNTREGDRGEGGGKGDGENEGNGANEFNEWS